MKAIVIEGGSGPAQALTLAERPDPIPGPGEILIEVRAAGVNRPDLLQREGLYPAPPGAPDVLGLEAAGVVGALVGFPALRLQGIYLVIATIAFALIVEEIMARWESITNGNEGMRVRPIQMKTLNLLREQRRTQNLREYLR